jgi:hypothetical protein
VWSSCNNWQLLTSVFASLNVLGMACVDSAKVTNSAIAKLKTRLAIGPLHQCAVGYNCRSQTAPIISSNHDKSHGFLPAAQLLTGCGRACLAPKNIEAV